MSKKRAVPKEDEEKSEVNLNMETYTRKAEIPQAKHNIEKLKVSNFRSWKFGSVNIRSGKEKGEGSKIYRVAKEAARAGLAFCCLQEVRYLNTGNQSITLNTGEKYEFMWCGMKKRREAGVGILIRIDPEISISEPDVINPRVMAVNIKIFGFNIRVVNCYSPTNVDGSHLQKYEFYRTLHKAFLKTEKHQKVVITGDFNAQTNIMYEQCYFDGIKIINDSSCNDNGSRLKSFCREKRLCLPQTYFDHPQSERHTWYSNDGRTRKVLDYILVEQFVQQYVEECYVGNDYDFESDHRVIITEMNTPRTKKARWKPKNKVIRRRDNKALEQNALQEKFIEKVENRFQSRGDDDTNNIYNNILDTITTAADETLPEINKKECNELWKNDTELNKLVDDRYTMEKGGDVYIRQTKLIKKRARKLKNEFLKSYADEINNLSNQRKTEELCRSFKNNNVTFRDSRVRKSCDPMSLRNYFMEHFKQSNDDTDPVELVEAPNWIRKLQNIPADGLNTDPPKKDEILDVLKKLKNGKAANDMPTIYLKYAIKCEAIVLELEKLYEAVWHTHKIPDKWSHTTLIAIWKGALKGKASDPKAYRALQIGSTFCKIMVVIILKRLNTWYESQLQEQQQGFRSERGTTDGVYILKRIQQISRKMNLPIYTLFVDLTAAFDHVNRKWMFSSIHQRLSPSVNHKLIELIEVLYRYTTTALKQNLKDIFELSRGVRQGGPESPTLFNLYIDYVMRIYLKKCKENGSIRFLKLKYAIPQVASTKELQAHLGMYGDHIIDWLGYADDLALFFMDEESLKQGLKLLDETFKRFHLAINVSKTKTMILNFNEGGDYPTTISSLAGANVDNVEVFRYLGCNICWNEFNTGDAEVNLRIDCAEIKFYELGKKFMNHNINLSTRVSLLNCLVRSRLTYGCQTWT